MNLMWPTRNIFLRALWALCALLGSGGCQEPLPSRQPVPPLPITQRGPGTVLQTLALNDAPLEAAGVRCTPVSSLQAGPKLQLATSLITSPSAIAQVGVPWPGRVVGVEVDIGQQVRAGQPLLRIDTPQMHRLVQDYTVARAQSRRAQDAFERQQKLAEAGVGAPQDLMAAQASAQALAAALAEAQEHLRYMGLTDNEINVLRAGGSIDPLYSTLRSPASGQVETIEVAMGQMLQGGETLMRILASQSVWAMVYMPERDLGQVRLGMPVAVTTVGYPDQPRSGIVSTISDLVDPNTRTSEVRVALNNQDGLLKPGMSGTATFQFGGENKLFLPITAVQQLAGGPIAFVCNKNGSFSAVRIAVGEERAGLLPLIAGLKHTDSVAVEGAFNLRAHLMRQQIEEP